MVARLLRPQETFNASLVDYINNLATLTEELVRHVDALETRTVRVEAGFGGVQSTHEELRTSIGVLQQTSRSLSKDMTRLAAGGSVISADTAGTTTPAVSLPTMVDGDTYVSFEDQFRGDTATIRERLSDYVPIFEGASDVLEIGCGRGEFLTLLRDRGIGVRGIDVNPSMVQLCQDSDLDAVQADALTYLLAQPDGSLGGVFAAQVVEHLEPPYLIELLHTSFDKLRPGAPIVLETINPACWFAFFESYLRDLTHVRALHPDTLKYLVTASGFQRVDITYRAPYPEQEKLQPIPQHPPLATVINTLNQNVEKLNQLIFTWLDYAVVGHRP